MLGLILGTGFGGGFVINGKIHSGQVGMAGELGHLQLNYHALKLLGWTKRHLFINVVVVITLVWIRIFQVAVLKCCTET